MALGARHGQTVEERARLAEECSDLQLQVFLRVKIFAHAQISLAERVVKSLDSLVELEVLFFYEAHLHEGSLVARFKRRI